MFPAHLATSVEARLAELARADIVGRIWARDHTVWQHDPAECADRLGWLAVHEQMFVRLPALAQLRGQLLDAGANTLLLLGMGGSSLAPEVMATSFGPVTGALRFELLDSTDPRQLADLLERLDLTQTVVVVSSKSGTTVETRAQFAFFREKIPDPSRFIVVTDPGTPLEAEARRLGIGQLFLNPPDIGGRFSALSYFGLVPAMLSGVDVPALLGRVGPMARACREPRHLAVNPGAWLGTVIAEAALAGKDKLTLIFPHQVEALGYWIEQLVAESTGKCGKGIVPVAGERLGSPGVYSHDRLFVAYGTIDGLDAIEAAGHPVVRLPAIGPLDLGAEFFRWEFATAIAGHILGINPFDQPNVEEAKQMARQLLTGSAPEPETPPAAAVVASLRPGDYLAILAYLPRNRTSTARLEQARHALRNRLRVAVTVGFGPRYLHSTGQLHKGGPNTGVFLVVEDPPAVDFPVPGESYTFAALETAQARGDVAALLRHGRRAACLSIDELERLAAAS